jgi:hypothetical protein
MFNGVKTFTRTFVGSFFYPPKVLGLTTDQQIQVREMNRYGEKGSILGSVAKGVVAAWQLQFTAYIMPWQLGKVMALRQVLNAGATQYADLCRSVGVKFTRIVDRLNNQHVNRNAANLVTRISTGAAPLFQRLANKVSPSLRGAVIATGNQIGPAAQALAENVISSTTGQPYEMVLKQIDHLKNTLEGTSPQEIIESINEISDFLHVYRKAFDKFQNVTFKNDQEALAAWAKELGPKWHKLFSPEIRTNADLDQAIQKYSEELLDNAMKAVIMPDLLFNQAIQTGAVKLAKIGYSIAVVDKVRMLLLYAMQLFEKRSLLHAFLFHQFEELAQKIHARFNDINILPDVPAAARVALRPQDLLIDRVDGKAIVRACSPEAAAAGVTIGMEAALAEQAYNSHRGQHGLPADVPANLIHRGSAGSAAIFAPYLELETLMTRTMTALLTSVPKVFFEECITKLRTAPYGGKYVAAMIICFLKATWPLRKMSNLTTYYVLGIPGVEQLSAEFSRNLIKHINSPAFKVLAFNFLDRFLKILVNGQNRSLQRKQHPGSTVLPKVWDEAAKFSSKTYAIATDKTPLLKRYLKSGQTKVMGIFKRCFGFVPTKWHARVTRTVTGTAGWTKNKCYAVYAYVTTTRTSNRMIRLFNRVSSTTSRAWGTARQGTTAFIRKSVAVISVTANQAWSSKVTNEVVKPYLYSAGIAGIKAVDGTLKSAKSVLDYVGLTKRPEILLPHEINDLNEPVIGNLLFAILEVTIPTLFPSINKAMNSYAFRVPFFGVKAFVWVLRTAGSVALKVFDTPVTEFYLRKIVKPTGFWAYSYFGKQSRIDALDGLVDKVINVVMATIHGWSSLTQGPRYALQQMVLQVYKEAADIGFSDTDLSHYDRANQSWAQFVHQTVLAGARVAGKFAVAGVERGLQINSHVRREDNIFTSWHELSKFKAAAQRFVNNFLGYMDTIESLQDNYLAAIQDGKYVNRKRLVKLLEKFSDFADLFKNKKWIENMTARVTEWQTAIDVYHQKIARLQNYLRLRPAFVSVSQYIEVGRVNTLSNEADSVLTYLRERFNELNTKIQKQLQTHGECNPTDEAELNLLIDLEHKLAVARQKLDGIRTLKRDDLKFVLQELDTVTHEITNYIQDSISMTRGDANDAIQQRDGLRNQLAIINTALPVFNVADGNRSLTEADVRALNPIVVQWRTLYDNGDLERMVTLGLHHQMENKHQAGIRSNVTDRRKELAVQEYRLDQVDAEVKQKYQGLKEHYESLLHNPMILSELSSRRYNRNRALQGVQKETWKEWAWNSVAGLSKWEERTLNEMGEQKESFKEMVMLMPEHFDGRFKEIAELHAKRRRIEEKVMELKGISISSYLDIVWWLGRTGEELFAEIEKVATMFATKMNVFKEELLPLG